MACQCASKGFAVGVQVDWMSGGGAFRYHGEITSLEADDSVFPCPPGRHWITVLWTKSNSVGRSVVTTQGTREKVTNPWLWAEACDETQLRSCGPVCVY